MTAGRLGEEQRAYARLLFFVFLSLNKCGMEALEAIEDPACLSNCLVQGKSGIIA